MTASSGDGPLTVGKTTVLPGKTKRFDLPFARLPTGTWESLPMAIVNGRKPGPLVWVSGAVHGDEINGVEITRRVLKQLDARKMSGAVIAVPIVNVLGFLNNSRYLPDGRDLNRSFPGSRRGSLASRLAHLFTEEVVSKCDVGIDLHTAAGHRTNAPQIRANLDDPQTIELAKAFGARFLIHAKVRDGSIRQSATEMGAKVLLYEAGQVNRFDEDSIQLGVEGVLRTLHSLGMGKWDVPAANGSPVFTRKTTWVRASRSGIANLDVGLGDEVKEGDRIGAIGDALGGRPTRVRATTSGFVIARTQTPLVAQGDALVHLAVPGAEGRDEPAERRRRR